MRQLGARASEKRWPQPSPVRKLGSP